MDFRSVSDFDKKKKKNINTTIYSVRVLSI